MPDAPPPQRNRAFLLLLGAIGVLILLGVVLLVTIVLVYRPTPRGRLQPPASATSVANVTPASEPWSVGRVGRQE